MARPILSLKKPKNPETKPERAGRLHANNSLFGLVGRPTEGKARCR